MLYLFADRFSYCYKYLKLITVFANNIRRKSKNVLWSFGIVVIARRWWSPRKYKKSRILSQVHITCIKTKSL